MLTREEFLKRRTSGIGGSDVAAVMGLSPWKTPLQVYLEKIGEAPEEEEPYPTGARSALYWGSVHEAQIAKAYSQVVGRKVCRFNRLLQHPDRPYFIGDIDRLVFDCGLPFNPVTGEVRTSIGLEIKTARFRSEEWGDEGSDNIPVPYYLQVQWYMMLAPRIERFDIAVLFAGSDLALYRVERDAQVIEKMASVCGSFWTDNVLAKVPPPPMTMDDLKKLRPWANVPRITADETLEKNCRDLAALQQKRKLIEIEEETLKFAIADAMGEAEQAETPAGEVLATYKNNKRGGRVLLLKRKGN